MISCGEPLGSRLRSYLENVFHTPVVNFYGASESLSLGVEISPTEGMLLFDEGNREFLHPLAVEGFCIKGLLDYQFRQTDKDTFEMLAEISENANREMIHSEMLRQMKEILRKKGLDYVQFCVQFVDQIFPDPQTGKKKLIISKFSEGRSRHERAFVAGARTLQSIFPERRAYSNP